MITIFFRTIIIYFILVFSLRVMGKRQIGELQVSEFIITLMLSEISVSPIINRSTPVLNAAVPVLLLLSLEVIISNLMMKNNKLKRLLYGSPEILIRNGKIIQSAMKKHRIEIDELLSELRQKGYPCISDINYVILEENGKMSVFPKAGKMPATPEDLSVKSKEYGIGHLIILDGSVMSKNLPLAGWSEKRLNKTLSQKSLSPKDIFLMTVDDGGRVTIILKEKQ